MTPVYLYNGQSQSLRRWITKNVAKRSWCSNDIGLRNPVGPKYFGPRARPLSVAHVPNGGHIDDIIGIYVPPLRFPSPKSIGRGGPPARARPMRGRVARGGSYPSGGVPSPAAPEDHRGLSPVRKALQKALPLSQHAPRMGVISTWYISMLCIDLSGIYKREVRNARSRS